MLDMKSRIGGIILSWEFDGIRMCDCPCGQGKITQKMYSDDWNRNEESFPVIECNVCKSEYHIKEFGFYTCDGEYRKNYYCIKNDYPSYTGSYFDVKEKLSNGKDFPRYLVENYPINVLNDFLKILKTCGTYAKIDGTGTGEKLRGVIRKYKSLFETQRITTICLEVKEAIDKYFDYEYHFSDIQKLKTEYEEYIRDMQSNSILLQL